jgi:Hemerythrin HHE cation binding domain
MDAITLLKDDHRRFRKMLEEGEETTERAVKTRKELLERLAADLKAHEKIEEEIFYPALKEYDKTKEIVLEGYEEHHVADLIVEELRKTDVADERWGAKFSVLKENLEHHIEEEEEDMFKKARAILDKAELVELGERMHAEKQRARRAA